MKATPPITAPGICLGGALVAAALLVTAPATADEGDLIYTGCLGRGGNLIHVMEGESPAQQCARSFTQVTWNERGQDGQDGTDGVDGMDGMDGMDGVDGQDGQDGVSGYEILAAKSLFFSWPVGEVRKLERDCPVGKVVLGGGVFTPDTPDGGAVLVVLSSAPTPEKNSVPGDPTSPKIRGWLGKVVNLGTSDDVGGAGTWAVDVTCADIAED